MSFFSKLFGQKSNDPPDGEPFMEHPTGEFKSSLEAMTSAFKRLKAGSYADRWIDFDFFGHQITAHLVPATATAMMSSPVDGDDVPVRHFGVILARADWDALAARLQGFDAEFLIEPRIRFRGQPGEQATMFVRDPSGNALEFKSFPNDSGIFATR